MDNNRKEWIEAASKLAVKPSEKILCPNCHSAFLNVNDVFLNDNHPDKGIERYIICEKCEKFEAILLRKENVEYGVTQNNNIWFNLINKKRRRS